MDPAGVDGPDPASGGGAGLLVILFIVLIIAPFNVLWLHVLDPTEDPTKRLMALMVLIPDFSMFLLLRGLASTFATASVSAGPACASRDSRFSSASACAGACGPASSEGDPACARCCAVSTRR